MQSVIYRTPTSHWMIVGANGLIGGEMARALSLSSLLTSVQPLATADYDREFYVKESIGLIRDRPISELTILFCAGKGGFSIGHNDASRQLSRLKEFCLQIDHHVERVPRAIFVSSLGCACSESSCPYTALAKSQEAFLLDFWRERGLILRLPSMYGYNRLKNRYSGLIGVMLANLKLRRLTPVYARLETRRNYLSARTMATALFARHVLRQAHLPRVVNVQAGMSLSVGDICALMYKAIKKRPAIQLLRDSLLDSESHYPSRLCDAKVIVNDNPLSWIKQEWSRFAPGFP